MTEAPSSWRTSRESGKFQHVVATFAAFHQEFAPLFGRTERGRGSEQYLRGLLVQQTDLRNAENLAEVIVWRHAAYLGTLRREAPWDDQPVVARLQGDVGRRLAGASVTSSSRTTRLCQAGVSLVGVARQYSGTLGKVGTCQIGVSGPCLGNTGTPRP